MDPKETHKVDSRYVRLVSRVVLVAVVVCIPIARGLPAVAPLGVANLPPFPVIMYERDFGSEKDERVIEPKDMTRQV